MISIETMLRYFSQIRRFYAVELKEHLRQDDFSLNEIEILLLLANTSTINTSRDISLILGISKGMISRSIETLRQKDLIVVFPDENDRRIGRIMLTKKANDFVFLLKQEMRNITKALFSDIDEQRIMELEETMEMIVSRFKGGKK